MTTEETFTREEVLEAVQHALAGYTNTAIRLADQKVEELEAKLRQAEELRARAWMKGYNLGRHDGNYHYRFSLSDEPLPTKARRNPYTQDGKTECGCGKQEPCMGFWQGFEAGEESLYSRIERWKKFQDMPKVKFPGLSDG
jgi:hypothetical protein